MTPQFTTPCYVQVDDKNKRKELAVELKKQGYKVCKCLTIDINPANLPCYVFNILEGGSVHILDMVDFEKGSVDCSTNIDLFLALAGMRSDTDMLQLFVYAEDSVMHDRGDIIVSTYDKHYTSKCRRATAQEIINHFKTK